MVTATFLLDLLTTHGWSYSALRDSHIVKRNQLNACLPPVVHDSLELRIVPVLDLSQPLPRIFVLAVHVVDLLVPEHDVENRGDE